MKYMHCMLVVQSYTVKDAVVNSLTSTKYNLFNGRFMFDLCDFFRNVTLA